MPIKFKKPKSVKTNLSRTLGRSKITRALTKRGCYGGSKEEWAKIRLKVLQRDNYTCKQCGKHKSSLACYLNVHHIRPISRGGSDALSNLVTLCENCHAKQPNHSHLKVNK